MIVIQNNVLQKGGEDMTIWQRTMGYVLSSSTKDVRCHIFVRHNYYFIDMKYSVVSSFDIALYKSLYLHSHGIRLQWSIRKLWQIFSNERHWSRDGKIDIYFFDF